MECLGYWTGCQCNRCHRLSRLPLRERWEGFTANELAAGVTALWPGMSGRPVDDQLAYVHAALALLDRAANQQSVLPLGEDPTWHDDWPCPACHQEIDRTQAQEGKVIAFLPTGDKGETIVPRMQLTGLGLTEQQLPPGTTVLRYAVADSPELRQEAPGVFWLVTRMARPPFFDGVLCGSLADAIATEGRFRQAGEPSVRVVRMEPRP